MKPRADVLDELDVPGFSVGAASTIQPFQSKRRPRAFPPGFAGAAPGPSHDEDEAPRRKPRRVKEE
jgi:hypothetical protein